MENPVKGCHVDRYSHTREQSHVTEEHGNKEQADQVGRTEMAAVDLDWECKGKLTIAQWGCDTSGHPGGGAR